MRSYNDIDHIQETLSALEMQSFRDFELWNHDSSSCDGTLEVILAHNDHSRILVNDPARYLPGRVLNQAVELCQGEIVVFLNSDATPTDRDWLVNLIKPLQDRSVGAVYGRQTARQDCRSLYVKDTERAFGNGQISNEWIHFFSMANSAARKEILDENSFSTEVQYSEDIEWSLRLKRLGYKIHYVQQAVVCHSHNYSLSESWRRHRGEGKAEAFIFTQNEIDFGVIRYVMLPLVMEVLRDLVWSVRHFSFDALFHSVPLRLVQKLGRWQGLREGLTR